MATVPQPATGTQTVTQREKVRVFGLEMSAESGLTAFAGGGQASGTPLQYGINRVTTVASAGDSALLPKANAGTVLIVINAAAANSMDVFPASGDAVNALSANTAFAIAANKTVIFCCAVDGTWNTNLTA